MVTIWSHSSLFILRESIKRREKVPQRSTFTPAVMPKPNGRASAHFKRKIRIKSIPSFINKPPKAYSIGPIWSRGKPPKPLLTILGTNHPPPKVGLLIHESP